MREWHIHCESRSSCKLVVIVSRVCLSVCRYRQVPGEHWVASGPVCTPGLSARARSDESPLLVISVCVTPPPFPVMPRRWTYQVSWGKGRGDLSHVLVVVVVTVSRRRRRRRLRRCRRPHHYHHHRRRRSCVCVCVTPPPMTCNASQVDVPGVLGESDRMSGRR